MLTLQILFDRAQAYAATHTALPASLYFEIGSLETLPRGAKRARSEEDADMRMSREALKPDITQA